MTSSVLIVCTANICRSPMAERLLVEWFARRRPADALELGSAGTHARPGRGPARGMQAVALAWGLDLSAHRARRVDAGLARAHDLIITMEDAHRSAVSRLAAGLGRRTFTLTELDELITHEPVPAGPGLRGLVDGWHAARARVSLHAPDVDDPYGGPDAGYARTAQQLAGLVDRIAPVLATALAAPDDGGRGPHK